MKESIILLAINYAEKFKGYTINTDKKIITIPFSAGRSKDDIQELMQPGSLCNWYVENGFNVSFEVRDVEYTTKPIFNTRSMTGYRGHTAFLRNRLVATITW